MSDELRNGIRLANLVLAVTTPIFVVAVLLLRNASEGVLQGLALVYFFGNLIALLVLGARAERREGRDQ